MTGEISFDLVMEPNSDFEEGTYRLPGGDWQVFIFSKRPVGSPAIELTKWDSGISGVWVLFPSDKALNRSEVKRVLGEALGVTDWLEVRGPDSLVLR